MTIRHQIKFLWERFYRDGYVDASPIAVEPLPQARQDALKCSIY